jgi:putative ABC transport system permease protein
VQGVAVAEVLPGMDHTNATIELDEEPAAGLSGHRVRTARVDIDFFDGFVQPILVGRGFDAGDLRSGANAIIVNTTFVERVLGGRNPIGRRVRFATPPGTDPAPWLSIVGVVGHLGMFEISPDQDQGVYSPLAPGMLSAEARSHGEAPIRRPLRVAIRTDTDAAAFVTRLRSIANDVDAAAIVPGAQRLDEVFSFDRYAIGWVRLGALAFVAILIALSASGTYALMSFTISQRTREIGIRTALGERRGSLIKVIARRAIAQIGLGALLGLLALGPLLDDLNTAFDRSFGELFLIAAGVGVGVSLVVGVTACVAPTLRALRITPVEALRS